MSRKSLKQLLFEENLQIQADLRRDRTQDARMHGFYRYHAEQQDSAAFQYKHPMDRIAFGVESGLIPDNDILPTAKG
jgi:hypothetical protein